MTHLYISYSSRSIELADNLHSVFAALGATVFNYRRPTENTTIDQDIFQRIRVECQASSFFVQIIDGNLGEREYNGVSLMRNEFDWFMAARGRASYGRSRPLLLVLPTRSAASENYVKYAEDTGAEVVHCQDRSVALQVGTGWFSKQRVLSHEHRAIPGHMDLDVAQPPVDSALSHAVNMADALIPQKLLYTSPFGALFWTQLARRPDSSVRRMYDIVNFGEDQTEPVSIAIGRIKRWSPGFPLSLIALGCGDGRREAMFAAALARAMPDRQLRVLLVDISKTLVATAAHEFLEVANKRSIGIKIAFALADFEHPRTMADLMRQWSPDLPVVIAFFGNTLGNIDFSSFLEAVGSAMKSDDFLITEVTLATAERGTATGKTPRQNVSPQHMDRFNFLTGPIRQLGICPKFENFKVQVEDEDLYSRRTYSYDMDEDEFRAIQSILGADKKRARVSLLRVDSFREAALLQEFSESFVVIGQKIHVFSGPIGKKDEVGRMGVILAYRRDGC